MGVTGLWDVLCDAGTRVGLDELRGKTLAVDLSVWLLQSERAAQLKEKQGMQPHLRNLFWRVALLMKYNVRLVFVLEGTAPKQKQATLEKRRIHSDKFYGRDGSPSTSSSTDDSRLYGGSPVRVEACCRLLSCLGVPHVQSSREAEATCAFLNQHQLVDGVVSEDGDCFLFGARTVYKGFNTESAKTDAIECYRMSDIESKLELTRDRLVAFGLLTGNDYDRQGVEGVGAKHALRLIKSWPQDGACQRLTDWRKRREDLDVLESNVKNVKKQPHCRDCDHLGTIMHHRKLGCKLCETEAGCKARTQESSGAVDAGTVPPCDCQWHEWHTSLTKHSLEIKVRKKARDKKPDFPNQEIIDLFNAKDQHSVSWYRERLQWNRPDYDRLQVFCQTILKWDEAKSREKLLPLLTSWDLAFLSDERQTGTEGLHTLTKPARVLKARTSNKKAVLDVQWESIGGVGAAQEGAALETEELRCNMEKAFPLVVSRYFQETQSSNSAKRKRGPSDTKSSKQLKINSMFRVCKKLVFPTEDDATNARSRTSETSGSRNGESSPELRSQTSRICVHNPPQERLEQPTRLTPGE